MISPVLLGRINGAFFDPGDVRGEKQQDHIAGRFCHEEQLFQYATTMELLAVVGPADHGVDTPADAVRMEDALARIEPLSV